MNQLLHIVIECGEDNYSAYIEEVDGIVMSGGTLREIRQNTQEAIALFLEACQESGCEIPDVLKGEYSLIYQMDVKSFLGLYYSFFTKSGLERLIGINQKQLWHYASGKSTPRKKQVAKIEKALHELGSELMNVCLY